MGASGTGTFSGTFIESRLVVLPEFLTFYFPELLVNGWLAGLPVSKGAQNLLIEVP